MESGSSSELERLVSIEAKLDIALQRLHDHEARLRTLERWNYAIPASLLSAAGAILVAVLK
jgi:hypothetical protein